MVRIRRVTATIAVLVFGSYLLAVGAFLVAGNILRGIGEALPFLNSLPHAADRSYGTDRTYAASLVFVGDVMLDRTVATRITKAKNDMYPFLNIKDDARFADADLQIMNLEGPVTDRRRPPEKSIDFLFDPRFLPVLKEIGFDAVSQANNHALDQGRVGADDSRRRLIEAGFIAFGDESRDNDVARAVTTKNGRRIAFVGFNSVSDPINDTDAEAVMFRARADADTVIAFMHWGEEYQSRPTESQEARAKWLIDRGADIVIGAHPHWVQSIASYNGKPIVYSLGNFVFDQDWSVETRQGLLIKLHISDGETAIDLHPIRIMNSQPFFVEGDERAQRLRDLSEVSNIELKEEILEGRLSF